MAGPRDVTRALLLDLVARAVAAARGAEAGRRACVRRAVCAAGEAAGARTDAARLDALAIAPAVVWAALERARDSHPPTVALAFAAIMAVGAGLAAAVAAAA